MKNITTQLLMIIAVMIFMTGTAMAQFENMFIEQTETTQQDGAFAKSGWSGAMNVGSSGVAYSNDYNAIKAALKTPTQVAAYMQENFTYQQDFRIDGFTPVSPSTLNESKWGDCKDFATFMGDVLADDGIKVQPISIRYNANNSSSSYHIMSVTTYNGAAYLESNQDIWQVSSNDEILSVANKNLPGGVVASSLVYYDPFTSYDATKGQYRR